MSLDIIFAESLFDALPWSLCVGNNYMTLTVFVLVGVPPCSVTTGVAGIFFWVFPMGITVFMVVDDFPFYLVQGPPGVLALGQYCNSLVRGSGPVQTTFALWVSELPYCTC